MTMRADVDRVRAHPLADIAVLLKRRDHLVEHPEHRFVQRQIDALSLAGGLARFQRNQRADRAVHAGHIVGQRRRARHHRHAPWFAGKISQARKRVRDAGEAGLGAHRPVLAVGRNAHQNGARVQPLELVISQSPFFQRSGPEILDNDIAFCRQLPQQFATALLLQIERDALLVAAFRQPDQRVAAFGIGAEAAQRIADIGRLDLDHLGAELAEDRRAIRARDEGAEIEHPDPFKRTHDLPSARAARSITLFASLTCMRSIISPRLSFTAPRPSASPCFMAARTSLAHST